MVSSDADKALDQAVRHVVTEMEGYEGELVTQWLVVYSALPADGSEERTIYGVIFPEGTMQNHIALGLLDLARDHVKSDD